MGGAELGAQRYPGGITSSACWPGPSPTGPWSPSSPPPARAPACCPLHPPVAAGGSDPHGPRPCPEDPTPREVVGRGTPEGFRQHLGPPETGSGAPGGPSGPRDPGAGGGTPRTCLTAPSLPPPAGKEALTTWEGSRPPLHGNLGSSPPPALSSPNTLSSPPAYNIPGAPPSLLRPSS